MSKYNFAENYPVWAQDATEEHIKKSLAIKRMWVIKLMSFCDSPAAVFQDRLTRCPGLVREDRLELYKLHLSMINGKANCNT